MAAESMRKEEELVKGWERRHAEIVKSGACTVATVSPVPCAPTGLRKNL
jgi:hypothetical protein